MASMIFYGLDDGARFRQHPAPGRSTACGTASLQTRRLHGQSWPESTEGAPAMHQSASTLCACAVPKSARGADPGLCARRSCSSALPACSSSGSSAGWRCSPGATPPQIGQPHPSPTLPLAPPWSGTSPRRKRRGGGLCQQPAPRPAAVLQVARWGGAARCYGDGPHLPLKVPAKLVPAFTCTELAELDMHAQAARILAAP